MDTPRAIPESHPLHRLFRGLTEYAFMNELGIGDPSLVGYVAELLASFVPSQAVWRLRDAQGRQLSQVTAMIAEAEAADDAARRRECHRHVGDFTLFWTGVYPEALAKLQGPSTADALMSYQQQGKRSYYLASTLSDGNDQGYVFRRLSDQFELCAFRAVTRPPRVGEDLKRRPDPGGPTGPWSSERSSTRVIATEGRANDCVPESCADSVAVIACSAFVPSANPCVCTFPAPTL